MFTKNWNMFKTWNCGDCCLHVEMFGVLKYCMFAKPLNSLGEAHSKQMLLVIYQPSHPSWSCRPAGQHLPCMTAHATSSKKKKIHLHKYLFEINALGSQLILDNWISVQLDSSKLSKQNVHLCVNPWIDVRKSVYFIKDKQEVLLNLQLKPQKKRDKKTKTHKSTKGEKKHE